MTDETLAPRFERDLRAMLAASEPADVPASLYAFVDAIPRPTSAAVAPRARVGWDRRALAVLLAAAVLAIVAVGVGSGIIRLPGLLPRVGAPTAVPHTQTYRLYYQVTPLDHHTPTAQEVDAAFAVLNARASAYPGSGGVGSIDEAAGTFSIDVEVPADDQGRLAELRAVLPTVGGVLIGTMSDGPIEVGASTDGRAFEPAYGSGVAFTPTLRPDGSALDLAIEAGVSRPFSDWASAHSGETGVVTTQEGLVLALAPIVVPGADLTWTIPFTPDQVAAGTPRGLLALFSAPPLAHPVHEVAPRGVPLAPGITPEPEPTPSPTVAPGNALHLEYQVQDPALAERTLSVLSDRIRLMGITTFGSSIDGGGRILLDLSIARDDEAATQPLRQLLGATGHLDLVPLGQDPVEDGAHVDLTQHPALISGDQVTSQGISYDQTGARVVQFTLSQTAAATFSTWTSDHVGESLAVVFDGTALSVPVIMSPIPDGIVQISGPGPGGWSEAEATRLVAILGAGELPTPITEVSSNASEGTPAPTATAASASLNVAGYADGCQAPGGCSYALDLRSADAEWQAALAIDAAGQATPGAGLPTTLDPGDYTVTASARRNPDALGGGIGDPGPVDATCTANFSVAPGDDVMVVSVTFGTGACTVSAGVPQ